MTTATARKRSSSRQALSRNLRAAIYTRISDARDGETAGVDRQQTDCETRIAQEGWTVVGVYCDNGKSAFKPGGMRPAYRQMLTDIANGLIDVVVCYATDRLYRQMTDLEELVDALGPVQVATVRSGEVDLSTADGRAHARLMGTLGQWESDKKAERVARAYQQRAHAGGWSGGTRRFGYNLDCTELVLDEAEALRWAYTHVARGGSLEAVVREFASRGLVGPKGGRIGAVQVRDYLLRARNAGIAIHQGEEVGHTTSPVIVEEETWRTVCAVLRDPARRTRVGALEKTMLAHVLRCGVCGGRLSGSNRSDMHGGKRRHVPIYTCRQSHVARTRQGLESTVGAMILEYINSNREQLIRPEKFRGTKEAGRASVEADRLRASLDGLSEQVANGDLTPADYAAATTRIRSRLAALETQVVRGAAFAATQTLIASGDVETEWAKPENGELRRLVVNELIESIVVSPVGKTGRWSTAGIGKPCWRHLSR